MLKTILMLVLFSVEIFKGVSCEEPGGDFGATQPTEEYLQIFKNIPRLFEFLIESLQDRPELLEKDDFTIFRNDYNGVSKRSVGDEDFYETDETAENPEYATVKEQKMPKKYDGRIKRDTAISDGDQLIDNYILKKDGNFLTITGIGSRLAPYEVEEQALKVEEMLEDYNRNKRE